MTTQSTRVRFENTTDLVPGIPLVLRSGEPDEPGRVTLSAGLQPVGGALHSGQRYRNPAFVPAAAWREPSASELAILQEAALGDLAPESFVAVFRLPERSLERIAPFHLERLTCEDQCRRLFLDEAFVRVFGEVVEDLWPLCASPEGLEAIGFNVGPPGLPSLGIDAGERLGIHVDDWDMAPIRARSRNRICINLGAEPRHFFYINVALDQLGSALGEDENGRGTRVGHRFMAAMKSYPVTRLRIDPGEAYIAPTDNLFHDGETTGKALPDMTYNILGHFLSPEALEEQLDLPLGLLPLSLELR